MYNASDFCNASSKDCSVTLGINWVSAATPINKNAYTCGYYTGDSSWMRLAVYYVTSCINGTCSYTTKNGLNSGYSFSLDLGGTPTWSIGQNSYSYNVSDFAASDLCGDWQYYTHSSGDVPCYSGANTSTSVELTFNECVFLENLYRTTAKANNSGDNWYYNAEHDCYVDGSSLGSYECYAPDSSGSGGGDVGFCGSCSINADCSGDLTCTGTCYDSRGSYRCCAANKYSNQVLLCS